MEVEVVRSRRRTRTVALRPTAEGVQISIPASATQADEDHYVAKLLGQWQRRQQKSDGSLVKRARSLAEKHGLQAPASIEWAKQKSQWGSCNTSTANIRISDECKKFPLWVLDYVIVHELAHLSYGGHGPRFWSLVERYPKTERARGFLIAKGLEDPDSDSGDEPVSQPSMFAT